MTRYVRDKGPICYSAPFFWRPGVKELPDILGRLSRVPALWWWHSERTDQKATRTLTRLTAETGDQFLDDLRERDEDGYGRTIFLHAIDGTRQHEVSEENVRQAIREFSQHERGIIEAVIVQINDSNEDFVFVGQQSSTIVARIWHEFEWTEGKFEDRPYSALRGAQLEHLTRNA